MSALDPAVGARRFLLDLFQAALAAVDGETCVARALRARPINVPVQVIAIGKAGDAMLRGACTVLGDAVSRALLITKPGHVRNHGLPQTCAVMESGHPLPDARSLQAGEALLDALADAPVEMPVLFLISGGASSLVEVLADGVTLDALIEANAWLLGSGLDIRGMNRVRSALSRIKGGRLLQHLRGRSTHGLLLSDVPGDDPAVIGSGLLMPAGERMSLDGLDLPAWLRGLCAPIDTAPGVSSITLDIIAGNRDAQQAVIDAAQAAGSAAHLHAEGLCGDALQRGVHIADTLIHAEAGVHVWGGETVVQLPARPGRGGRNQALALSAALGLQGRDDVWLLAAGTDGSDGPTEDAGALVDGGSIRAGELSALDARSCLQAADAGRFLEASGDLIQTGPTGTNVMDLVIGLRV